jgi:hypothetical protein
LDRIGPGQLIDRLGVFEVDVEKLLDQIAFDLEELITKFQPFMGGRSPCLRLGADKTIMRALGEGIAPIQHKNLIYR